MSLPKSRFRALMMQHEKAIIEDALRLYDGHHIKAAVWLEIHPESVRRKMVRYGLTR